MNAWNHAIVTGGGSGLGLGFALRLLRRGCKVSVFDRNLSQPVREQLLQAAQSGNAKLQDFSVDVSDWNGVETVVNATIETFGSPDLVIHCAGITFNRDLSKTGAEDFREVVDINLKGSFHIAKAVLPHMQPGSRLALVASMAGLTGNYGLSAYGSSKFGMVGLAATLRYEYEPRGIGISCICPPEVRTPMVAMERSPGNHDEISLILKDMAGSLEIDEAVDEMFARLGRGQWMIIPGRKAKLVALLFRYFPALHFASAKWLVKRAMCRLQGT